MKEKTEEEKIEEEFIRKFILANPLFRRVQPGSPALKRFLDSMENIHYKRGQKVYEKGEKAKNVYIVRDGELHILGDPPESPVLAIHGRGSLFGEVSLLAQEDHSAIALAALDTRILVIPGTAFFRFISEEPSAGSSITRLLSQRFRSNMGAPRYEYPSRIHIMIYPENPERGSKLSLFLARALLKENPGTVLLIHINPRTYGDARKGTLVPLLEKSPRFDMNDMKNLTERDGPYDVLHAEDILETTKNLDEKIPGFLGILRKYYSAVLIDLAPTENNENINTIINQCDRMVLLRSMYGGENRRMLWRHSFARCSNLIEDNDRIITATDEPRDVRLSGESMNDIRKGRSQLNHVRLHILQDRFETDTRSQIYISRLSRKISGTSRGLCLGGGGARSLAHIGALDALERENLHFDAVAGTSMGAVIGAAHAMGLSASEIRYLVRQHLPDSSALLDKNLPFVSFFRGKKLNKMLRNIYRDLKFEDLELPFFCNGTDLNSGNMIVFDRGYLSTALRASVSIPGVFPPLKLGNYSLVDGAVLNNLPGIILREKGFDRIIGINVTPLVDRGSSQTKIDREHGIKGFLQFLNTPPILRIITRTISIEGREIMKFRLDDFDYVISPDIANFDIFDFHMQDHIMDTGKKAVRDNKTGITEALTRNPT